jgi:hypothetical protein
MPLSKLSALRAIIPYVSFRHPCHRTDFGNLCPSSTPPRRMDNSGNPRRTRSFWTALAGSNLRRSNKVPLTCSPSIATDGLRAALDISVKWFIENYDTARTGNKKA